MFWRRAKKASLPSWRIVEYANGDFAVEYYTPYWNFYTERRRFRSFTQAERYIDDEVKATTVKTISPYVPESPE